MDTNPGVFPPCPHCGSDDVLPFEDDTESRSDGSLFIVIISALAIIGGYFLIVLSSYLSFPFFVFVIVALIARSMRGKDRKKRRKKRIPRDYMCLECSAFFRG